MKNKFKITKFRHGEAFLYVDKYTHLEWKEPLWQLVLSISFEPGAFDNDGYIQDMIGEEMRLEINSATVKETL